jgi:hypothetical protein
VAVAGVVLAGGMLGLLRLTGGPLELVSGPVANRPPSATVTTAVPTTDAGVTSTAEAGAEATATTTAGADDASVRAAPSALSSDAVARDPVGVLQHLADQRAAALLAADPVLLVGAEPRGSGAHEGDAQTIARLRDQRQRYVELTFAVRSAEVVSAAPTMLVLRAVVDRSAYGVVGEDGSTQRVEAGSGVPLRYTLTLGDGGWRLTEVGPP